MKRHSTQIFFGLALIIAGALMLLHKLHAIDFNGPVLWGALLAVCGLTWASTGIVTHRNGAVFCGTWAFLYGVFLLLRAFHMIEVFPHIKIFAALLSLAMSFLVLFILTPRDFGNLISAVCVGAGALWIYFAATNELWAEDLRTIVQTYWPLALILFGINALARGWWRGRAPGK